MKASVDLGAASREFLERLPFTADAFQLEALAAIERGESVVVTAPTGAGKTLVAEAAVHLSLARHLRAFYTAPIKALSNQKFSDFRDVYGEHRVGLLTGDNVVNPEADLIVMTTEVLRNMIYAGSGALDRLGVVVLDEVHYLQDRYRGSVWEEVIIHLPLGIPLVSLSATVANAEEFTDWMRARRGPTTLVTEDRRPVPLEAMYLVTDRYEGYALEMLPIFTRPAGRPNQDLSRMLKRNRGRRRRYGTPRRSEVATFLADRGLLPAIYFIFSRAGCDRAAETVAAEEGALTTAAEQKDILAFAQSAVAHIPGQDLASLGFDAWVGRLQKGVAAHHAGMVPAFKEVVEGLFVRGLIKLVFATETLSLGINMPARAVVLEQMSKFNGETHETLTRGEFTQLTGRAGRRGIDTLGTAVVLHDSRMPFDKVAAVAVPGSEPLRSSFQPTYNMAVNLIANYEEDDAEGLLSASFAQFHRQRMQEGVLATLGELRRSASECREEAACDRGDIWAYVAESGGSPARFGQEARAFLQRTKAGDVLTLSGDDRWLLLARSRGASPRLLLVSESGAVRRLSAAEVERTIGVLGRIPLPEPIRTRDDGYLTAAARLLERWEANDLEPEYLVPEHGPAHPVESCPDLEAHLSWVRRLQKTEREIRKLERRAQRLETGMVGRFRGIRGILEGRGYLSGWAVTPRGDRLRYVYNERDLLLAEGVEAGVFAGLDPAETAALVSAFTFDPRAEDVEETWPTRAVEDAATRILGLWKDLADEEQRGSVPETRRPEGGFAAIAHAWASGIDLPDLLDEESGSAGDFVRNCRTLIDLLRQIRDAYPALAETAAQAIRSIDRGIVAVGGRF